MAKAVAFGQSVAALKEKLKENPAGAYLFFGPEELLKHFYLEKFIALIEKEGAAAFNLARLDLSRDHTLGDLAEEVQILPMLGEKRLVIVRGLEPLKLSEKDGAYLLSALADLPETTICILYCTAEEFAPDKKALEKKFIKNCASALFAASFPLQPERVLLGWAQKILAKDGKTASDAALRLLTRVCGGKMQIMQKELDKLACYATAHGRAEITEADVALFAVDRSEFALYQLSDAVLAASFSGVEKIFVSLKRDKVSPIPMVASLSRTFVNALLIATGADEKSARAVTGIADWQYRNLQDQIRGVPRENLQTALSECLACDRTLKSYHSDPYLICEELLLSLCGLFVRRGRA